MEVYQAISPNVIVNLVPFSLGFVLFTLGQAKVIATNSHNCQRYATLKEGKVICGTLTLIDAIRNACLSRGNVHEIQFERRDRPASTFRVRA